MANAGQQQLSDGTPHPRCMHERRYCLVSISSRKDRFDPPMFVQIDTVYLNLKDSHFKVYSATWQVTDSINVKWAVYITSVKYFFISDIVVCMCLWVKYAHSLLVYFDF